MKIKVKRVYEQADSADGRRVLVDRLWPRGLTKEKAAVDVWLKEIAPSTELRKWFGHEPPKWAEFKRRYHAELGKNDEAVAQLREEVSKGTVTLLYGSREETHNHAVVLKDWIEKHMGA